MKKEVTYTEELYVPVAEKATPAKMGTHVARVKSQIDNLYRQTGHPHLKLVEEPTLDCVKAPGGRKTIEVDGKSVRVDTYFVTVTYSENPFDYRSPEEIQRDEQEQAAGEVEQMEQATQKAAAKKTTRKRAPAKKAAAKKATRRKATRRSTSSLHSV
jgi:hypothetical protein